ncbi:histidinol dehydrogenase [candidate division MSBL1 archaeon SCGC-AAA261C02]|uniref:Histidinol dehydrogenase n=1 Tax=candidate division MSBL1 archaeon SCGC-AAA261C02 TaxID=1698272 RepID=A0A133UZ87_9EURY|nr:histidinol dehydrogenase [candidate division MSBL1 archaeon SCGC-AAA261C02]
MQLVRLWKHPQRYYGRLLSRSEGDVAEAMPKARKIISDVEERGDIAIINYTKKFDGVTLSRNSIKVSESEVKEAYKTVKDEKIEALKTIAERVRKYHERQVPDEWMNKFGSGIEAGQIIRPIESVGIYAPGGAAQYPSSVLMTAIPAKVAGVKKIIVCTPPNSEGKVSSPSLIAADLAEVDEVYRIGGAQAIGAMAYGTRTVPRVEKIAGPGNVYVVAAKQIVSNDVDIDFAAGPSEVLIIADSTANPRRVAIDLIAQAEHDPSAAAVLATSSEKLAEEVCELISGLLKETTRRRVAAKALKKYGRVIITRSLKNAIKFANDYAPEHLQLMVKHPKKLLNEVQNAGAIFIGSYTPVAAGDLAIGPSHVLPTGGVARKRSGLSVLSFIRMPSVQKLTKKGLENLSEVIEELSELEGLEAHAKSVRERLK